MGASEGLQSLFSYSSGPILHLLVSNWECLEISTSFSISWITFCHVILDYSFHSMSLACFFPRTFISFSWLGTSFQLVVFCLMLWDMFIDHDHLFTLHTYHGLSTSFFVWSLVRFSTRCSYFHYGKVKGMFSHSIFFKRFALSTLSFFLFMELEFKVELRMCGYRWSIDLMIVCFSHLFHLRLLIGIL